MATVQVTVDTAAMRTLIQQAKDQVRALGDTLDQINEARKTIPVVMTAADAPVAGPRAGGVERNAGGAPDAGEDGTA